MAKFIELDDGFWLNIDKIEVMVANATTWRKENDAYIVCTIQAMGSSGKRYQILDVTSSGEIPKGQKRRFDKELEKLVNSKLNGIMEWLTTAAAIQAVTTVKVPGDLKMDLIVAMNAVVNNTQAEEAEECE